MKPENPYRFNTQVIHVGQTPESWEGATLPPIFQTASHLHPTAEHLSETFAGKTTDHIYMRLTNPTNRVLEEKIDHLGRGTGGDRHVLRHGGHSQHLYGLTAGRRRIRHR